MPSQHRMRRLPSFRYLISSFFILYFVQGMPYGLQTRFLPIFFRIHGMSLSSISLYKLLLIPWVLKAFWAPLVDMYGQKKTWLDGSLLCLGFLCTVASIVPPEFVVQLAVIMFLFNFITSIQDIALDSLVIEILTPAQLAKGNIAQVVGYKTGMLFSGGVFALLTEMISWANMFYGLAAIYFVAFLFSLIFVPSSGDGRSSFNTASNIRRSQLGTLSPVPGMEDPNSAPHVPVPSHQGSFMCYFGKIFKTEGTIWMLIFVIFYKIGEQGILNSLPLYLLDKGVSARGVGFWTGFIGQGVSIFGSIFGGLYWTRHLFLSLKVFMIIRGVAAFFIFVSLFFWNTFGDISYTCSIVCLLLVFFSGGAITTVTYTLIMHLSKQTPRECRASHYTALVTGDIVGRIIFAAALTSLAQWTSYLFVFSLFSIMCLSAVLAISFAPYPISQL